MLALILLTCSTVVAEPPVTDLEEGPGKAPALSRRPAGLPLALMVPDEARCVDLKGSQLAGTFLPAPLDLYIARRDLALDLYTAAAQRRLDEEAAVWSQHLDNAVAEAKATAMLNSVDRQLIEAESKDVPLWATVALTFGGIAVGAGLVRLLGL